VEEDTDDEVDLDQHFDDPMGLSRLEKTWRRTTIGIKRAVVEPDKVEANHFVIIRANGDAEDKSSFKMGDIDIRLWLCKASE
jgi:hypothetical protein